MVYVPVLTVRQAQVLELVALGYGNKVIARKLGIKAGTVKNHVSALMSKFGASSRTQMVVIANQVGLLTSQDASCLADRLRNTFLAKHQLVARLIEAWDREDMAAYKQTLAELDEIGRKLEAGFVKVKPDIVLGSRVAAASLDGQPEGHL